MTFLFLWFSSTCLFHFSFTREKLFERDEAALVQRSKKHKDHHSLCISVKSFIKKQQYWVTVQIYMFHSRGELYTWPFWLNPNLNKSMTLISWAQKKKKQKKKQNKTGDSSLLALCCFRTVQWARTFTQSHMEISKRVHSTLYQRHYSKQKNKRKKMIENLYEFTVWII